MKTFIDYSTLPSPFLSVCFSEKEFKQTLRFMNIKDYDQDWLSQNYPGRTHHFENPERDAIVVCFDFNNNIEEVAKIGLIAHEAVHVWQFIETTMNDQNRTSCEVEAYSIQSIFVAMLQRYVEDKKAKKNHPEANDEQ